MGENGRKANFENIREENPNGRRAVNQWRYSPPPPTGRQPSARDASVPSCIADPVLNTELNQMITEVSSMSCIPITHTHSRPLEINGYVPQFQWAQHEYELIGRHIN